jgi:octaprenyl-diphosphate synthase
LNLKEVIAPVKDELQEFQSRFSEELKSKVALIDIITKYIHKQKGKQIRPALVLLSAKLCGGITDRTYIAANMVELLHTATLIHDDVVDEAKERRGFASINAVWKNKAAVLIGDYLLSKGLLIALEGKEFNFLHATSEAVRRMSEGELLQIQKARNFDGTEETYFKVISDKTASLIKTCCRLGAMSTTEDEEKITRLSDFGENLGIAFQLRDDLLDYIGRKKLLGKSPGNDVKEKKFTLPLIISLQNAPKGKSKDIIKLIKDKPGKAFEKVYSFVKEYGGLEYTQDKIKEYSSTALESICVFPENEVKNSLKMLVDFIEKREY